MKNDIVADRSELDNLEELIKLKLKNPNFRKRWEYLDGNYQLAKLIINNRLDSNMSRRDLANKIKTSLSVISRIESLSVNVTTDMANRIANAFGKRLEIKLI
jgi:ribosome-binding protein aMBF1 (putative translation factor)